MPAQVSTARTLFPAVALPESRVIRRPRRQVCQPPFMCRFYQAYCHKTNFHVEMAFHISEWAGSARVGGELTHVSASADPHPAGPEGTGCRGPASPAELVSAHQRRSFRGPRSVREQTLHVAERQLALWGQRSQEDQPSGRAAAAGRGPWLCLLRNAPAQRHPQLPTQESRHPPLREPSLLASPGGSMWSVPQGPRVAVLRGGSLEVWPWEVMGPGGAILRGGRGLLEPGFVW